MGSFDCLLKVGSTKYLGQPGGNINQTLSILQLAPSCLQLEDQYYEDLLFYIGVLRVFGVRVMVKRCESDDSKM